jgi:hypothetical protein
MPLSTREAEAIELARVIQTRVAGWQQRDRTSRLLIAVCSRTCFARLFDRLWLLFVTNVLAAGARDDLMCGVDQVRDEHPAIGVCRAAVRGCPVGIPRGVLRLNQTFAGLVGGIPGTGMSRYQAENKTPSRYPRPINLLVLL